MEKEKNRKQDPAESARGNITIGEKLSLEHCRKILNRDGNNYTDEQILEIRDFIYAMATIDYLFFIKQFRKKHSINTNQNQNNDEQQSIPLHPGEHRRAS